MKTTADYLGKTDEARKSKLQFQGDPEFLTECEDWTEERCFLPPDWLEEDYDAKNRRCSTQCN